MNLKYLFARFAGFHFVPPVRLERHQNATINVTRPHASANLKSTPEEASVASKSIRTYSELRGFMREALRKEHPEWVGPCGESALCDAYEVKLAWILELFASRNPQPQNR